LPAEKKTTIITFDLEPGSTLARNYKVLGLLGAGWEGEVYKVIEKNTGIERAAKLFFPHRNLKNKTSNLYARKLHNLHRCPIVIQYHAEEQVVLQSQAVTVLISEFVDGELLSDFLRRQPGKRLSPFQAIHLLYVLISGLESIHNENEYHGDLHPENIIVARYGLNFELKLLDLFHTKSAMRENVKDDICSAVKIFHQALGGAKWYSKQPNDVKQICCGLRHTAILKKFPRASVLRSYLETMQWN
jgi:serine/threonine protein kinase